MSKLDFRDFLARMEAEDRLMRVGVEVDPLDEMGAFIARADYEGVHKPILFEKPTGYGIPVLANTVGHSYRAMAEAFGVPEEGVLPATAMKMMQTLRQGGIPPLTVDRDEAPCKEVILTGKQVDLGMFPWLRQNPHDGQGSPDFTEGRFISSVAMTDPKPGAHNLSYHRFEVTGPDKGTVWIFRGTGDAKSIEDHWGSKIDDSSSTWDREAGRPFPMAFVCGLTPEFILAGANSALPHEGDDFAFIGGVAGEPVKLVKCETIDVHVPASAEIVIEGIMKPFNFTTQGKFASFNGFYDDPRRRPIFDVTAITMRKDPNLQHVHIGRPLNECNSIASFFRSVRVFAQVKEIMPNLVDVFVDPSAGCGFTVHMSITKGRVGEPKMAMMRAYTALGGFAKHVFVYDDDIDIRDPRERDWALAHRFIPDRDLMIVPNVIGMTIEPMAQGLMGDDARLGVYDGHPELLMNTRSLMGVDCTVPLGLKDELMERVVPVPELEARVDELWAEALRTSS